MGTKIVGRREGRCRVRSMDSFLENQNLNSIRNTMLAQEDIFKNQVRELHRVYGVQKVMMEELKKETKQRRQWSHDDNLTYPQQPAASHNNSSSFFLLDFNNSSNQRRRDRSRSGSGIELESPAAEISAVDLGRPTRTNGSDTMEEIELELTLSIGMSSSSDNQRETTTTNNNNSSTTSFRSDNVDNNNNKDCSGQSTPMSSSSTTLDQEKKRSHWLFQGLSINRT
ncbi:PREDICTED: probable serine/threonine-protein kinase fhkE isoform X2 [Tarenaya hassleriana]|nr:PREDICTED: probable serine/threonine-protein kinase fhkE isoform X2 [Tarenaya hassleriana]